MTSAEIVANSGAIAQPMNTHQLAIHKRIQAFSFDALDDDLPFSRRLARDNNWTTDFALDAIEEYKKFAFLAVVADHPVTPSDQVDQVWHLHLTYTRSYWDDFCANVLKQPLHHEPTKGGEKESEKFDKWYNQTLESYEHFFEQAPPIDLWPTAEDRFNRDSQFIRVNQQQRWIIPKPPISREMVGGIVAAIVAMAAYLYTSEIASNINPIGSVVLMGLCGTAGFSLVQFIAKFLDALNRKSPVSFWSAGCGVGGCGGCGGCGFGCGGGGCGGG